MPIKPIKTITNLDPSQYENTRTGEPLSTPFQQDSIKIMKTKDSGYSEIHSESYIVFDSNAAEYIQNILTDSEYAKTIKMAHTISAPYNVLQKDRKDHSSDSLQEYLGLSKSKFYNLVRALVKKGVLAYAVCAPIGIVKKVYFLNPTIARRSKKFNNSILAMFPDFSTKKYMLSHIT